MAIKNFYTGVYIGDNLGIGTTPSEALQVQGSARIQADSNNFLKISTDQTQTTFANSGNGIVSPSMLFKTGADTRLTILGLNGNVGIGTTTPPRQLTLGGAAPVLSLHSTSTTGESSIYFGDTADDNEGRIVYSNSQITCKFGPRLRKE